jgi:iron complex outermembrane receptor protein
MKMRLFKEINWGLQLNNIFNKMYQPNGYTYSYYYNGKLETENFYYPMAGTNFMIAMNIKF